MVHLLKSYQQYILKPKKQNNQEENSEMITLQQNIWLQIMNKITKIYIQWKIQLSIDLEAIQRGKSQLENLGHLEKGCLEKEKDNAPSDKSVPTSHPDDTK